MWAKKLKILFVCLAGCLAVFSTVIPHHHHENGMICWVIDAAESGDTHSSDVPEKAGDCSGCSWFAYKAPVDTVSLNQYLLKQAHNIQDVHYDDHEEPMF